METVKSPAEQRVILRNISWETYERLLEERGDSRVPRLAYDRGELEIMSPSSEHESVGYFVSLLVAVLAEEMGVNAYGVGSTTYKRGDLGRGFEPDASFYIANEEPVRGKPRIDLAVDPPPDLVIEIDITSPSLDKFPIYARLGVHEVWRYDGNRFEILSLGERDSGNHLFPPPLAGLAADKALQAPCRQAEPEGRSVPTSRLAKPGGVLSSLRSRRAIR